MQEPFVKASRKLLGEYGCIPLMAVEKLKEKAAWQLYAGANDVKPNDANQISQYIDEYNKKLKYADDDEKEFIHVEDFIPNEYIELYKQSLEYQGIVINLKCHACGYMIFNGDIRKEIGLISAISETTGKRTLVACIEGGYLDEFGYVKEDFLIVDSVSLTHELFESIGKTVPSFDELREMVSNDKLTWEIYEKGITCCINQYEKESTSNKAKRYKLTNLAESSAFIAGIRPGFKSLINTFINREDYTTGEKLIDDLLTDSSHFMLYQESIMKVLSFLGIPMGDTYGVIKAISKKKLKGEKKEKLQNTLKANWKKQFGNLDNFYNVWNVIEDSAAYAFNAPHALSMGGDSAYLAWFKSHYTAKFYEVAINHYQDKNNKDKIDSLVKEAMKFYGYKLGYYQFGKDNRRVTIDEKEKFIYPNISSIKGFGDNVANILYELGLKTYTDFMTVITECASNSINKTNIDKLVKIDYFKQFGDINTLLKIIEYYELFNGTKEISKKKIAENNLDISLISKYGNETEKKYTKLQAKELLEELITLIPYEKISLKQILDNQKDVLGIVTAYDKSVNERLYYISNLEIKKSIVNISIYEIFSGKTRQVKMWTTSYNKKPFKEKDVLYIISTPKKNKREPNGQTDEKTGKRIYVDIPNKFEYWLEKYIIKQEIE